MDLTELQEFGRGYAGAWSSQDPDSVGAFYADGGRLSVNENPPAVGRAAIAEVVRGFMSDFPDMKVVMDELAPQVQGAIFRWPPFPGDRSS